MLKLGRINQISITEITPNSYILEDGKHSFQISKSRVSQEKQIGDKIEGFIYSDRNGKFIFTTRKPYAQLGEFAYLKVLKLIDKGAFVDWGIETDLFVPTKEFTDAPDEDRRYFFFIKMDSRVKQITGTTAINDYLVEADQHIKDGDQIEFLVTGLHRLGFRVIVNNRYQGLIYQDEIIGKLEIGEKKTGFVKLVRDDGKVDVVLFQNRFGFIKYAENIVLKKLEQSDGFLPLHDKTLPIVVENSLGMSKKVFKKAIGGLYRRKKISIDNNKGIKLLTNNFGSTIYAPK